MRAQRSTSRSGWVRAALLAFAPLPIVTASFSLTHWFGSPPAELSSNSVVLDELVGAPIHTGNEVTNSYLLAEAPDRFFEQQCLEAERRWQSRLGPECQVITRCPLVIGGDLDKAALERWYQQTIGPACRAMANSYFDVPPHQPITVLLFSTEASYNRYARELFDEEGISVYGYYKPLERTLVMNIATGGGTLVHELTHALIDFDFPGVPDWFNEGLASLHEQCRFRADESGIDGLVNWRLPGLQEAIAANRARTVREMIVADDFRGPLVGINYAQARYFCLFMQQRGVLEKFYRQFRANAANDPLGLATIEAVLPASDWNAIEADFRQWVLALSAE